MRAPKKPANLTKFLWQLVLDARSLLKGIEPGKAKYFAVEVHDSRLPKKYHKPLKDAFHKYVRITADFRILDSTRYGYILVRGMVVGQGTVPGSATVIRLEG